MQVSGMTWTEAQKRNGTHDVKTHRGDIIAHGTVTPETFWNKLFSYPITAFGYQAPYPDLPNPKFSKHEVIHALDFWIEHWVYQNQLEYTFSGTVNVDHEITLKEMILVREKIMKMPSDTMFTRSKIKHTGPITEKWEDSEAVFCEDSSLDPFCYKVITKTVKQVNKEFEEMPKQLSQAMRMMGEVIGNAAQHAGIAMNQMAEEFNRMAMQAAPVSARVADIMANTAGMSTPVVAGDWNTIQRNYNPDPNTWRSVPNPNGNEHNSWKVVDPNDVIIASHFRLNRDAQAFIDGHRQGIMTIREGIHASTIEELQDALNQPGSRVIVNGPITATENVTMNGIANEQLRPGDLVIRDSEGRLVRANNNNVNNGVVGVVGGVNFSINRNIGRDANGDMVHVGEPNISGSITINGVEHEVSNVRLRMEPQHPDLPGFQIPEREGQTFSMITVPIEAQTITVQDDDDEEDGEGVQHSGYFMSSIYSSGTRPNSYGRVEFSFNGGEHGRTVIELVLYITGQEEETILQAPQNTYNIELLNHNNVRINGETYHSLRMSVIRQ